jgi:hypothetical protein
MPTFKPDASDLPEGQVLVRVLPLGDRKLFTGETNPLGLTVEDKFPTHEKGAVIGLPRAVAEAQEALGRVEIQ